MTEQQLITRVDFAAVQTQDLERSVHFYGETLGLPCSVHLPDRHVAEFETGNLTFTVIVPEAMGRKFAPNPAAIALHVEDVEAARAKLEMKGVQFFGDTFDSGVCHMAFFADPDGNALMLHHRYKPRT